MVKDIGRINLRRYESMGVKEDMREYKKMIELNSDGNKKGPYGCKCQTLAHHVTGEGCDECNPERAKELSEDDD